MKVSIVGAGGIGGYLGALLAKAGHQVLLIDPWQEHIDAIQQLGLRICGQESFSVRVPATSDPSEDQASCDLLVLATKNTGSAETESLLDRLNPACATSVQNGPDVSNPLISRFGRERVFGMISLVSGSLLEPGLVKGFKGQRVTFLGELDGSRSERIAEISEVLQGSGLNVVVPDHIEVVRWTKLVWWIPHVVLPALTRLTLGEAMTQSDLAAVCVQMERECAAVATAHGHHPEAFPGIEVSRRLSLPFDEAITDVLNMGQKLIAEGNGSYEVAMLLDLKRRRRTEATNTIGAIVNKAWKAGIPVPFTECAWRLVKAIEANF